MAPRVTGIDPLLDCTLAVAHPDDDAIFAGELQRRLRGARWTVVCVTYTADSRRGRELVSWQTSLGTPPDRIHFLGQPDPADDWRRRHNSIPATAARRALRHLRLAPSLVITHNHRGEYGHPHHRLTHDLVATVFPDTPRLTFAMGLSTPDLSLPCPDKHQQLRPHFPSQAAAIRRVARPHETFRWEIPPPPEAAALFSELFAQP